MDIKLVNGRRYLFYNKELKHRFRANFIDIITNSDGYKTLRIEKYIYESGDEILAKLVTMPFSWINKIETLVDIANGIVNDDILLEIDLYL